MTPVATADSASLSVSNQPLSPEELRKMNAYWRAANYLSVGQIYLYANPLLREPLKLEHVKPRLLGHWGTTDPAWWRTPTSKAHTRSFIPAFNKTKRE